MQHRARDSRASEVATRGVSGSGRSLPFLERIQPSFGRHDVSNLRAYHDLAAARASAALDAHAYATGDKVAFGSTPDLHTAAHEAAHAVQLSHGVDIAGPFSRAGDRYESHANEVADAVVAGRSAEPILDRMASANARATSPSAGPVMREPLPPNKSGWLFVPFDDKGGWDATEILAHISQNEGTATLTPAPLPEAGSESDRRRCGSNTSLSVAIVGGPMRVIELCKALRAKIDVIADMSAKGAPGLQSLDTCNAARADLSAMIMNVYLGTKGGAHEGGGSTLMYQHFDRLAHWMYVFSYDPDDPTRASGATPEARANPYRSTDEVRVQAEMAGYEKDQRLTPLYGPGDLDSKTEALAPGQSLMVGYRVHFINFFRNSTDNKIYCYDGWGATTVFAKGTPEYEAKVAKLFEEGANPRVLKKLDPSMFSTPLGEPGGLRLSH